MENEVLVKVENLSKKFCKDLKTGLWYGVKDLFAGLGSNKNERELRDNEFWALRDINFELRRGECLGLIGHNGAGKSTLLKILNGLINPDHGKVTIKGKVGALIELGAGFNPILTGRENIYNNGAILGFSRKEIDKKVEDIIDFAEIREFIDMPVQHYSSGMKVRLGFAVAAQMEPDVLIIDEVLAVGDVAFRMKCYNAISSLLRNTAIIFVSHSMPQVSKICTNAILLRKGRITAHGQNISEVINKYFINTPSERNLGVYSDGKTEILSMSFNGENSYSLDAQDKIVYKGGNISLHLHLKLSEDVNYFGLRLVIYDKEMKGLVELNSLSQLEPILNKGENHTDISFQNTLNNGIYSITLIILEVSRSGRIGNRLYRQEGIFQFKSISKNGFDSYIPFSFDASWNFN